MAAAAASTAGAETTSATATTASTFAARSLKVAKDAGGAGRGGWRGAAAAAADVHAGHCRLVTTVELLGRLLNHLWLELRRGKLKVAWLVHLSKLAHRPAKLSKMADLAYLTDLADLAHLTELADLSKLSELADLAHAELLAHHVNLILKLLLLKLLGSKKVGVECDRRRVYHVVDNTIAVL